MTVQYQSTILLRGKTATGFQVPAHIVDSLDAGRKPSVIAGMGPHTYRSTVAVYGGEYLVPHNAENRRAAGVSAGETVQVSLTLDTAATTIEVSKVTGVGVGCQSGNPPGLRPTLLHQPA